MTIVRIAWVFPEHDGPYPTLGAPYPSDGEALHVLRLLFGSAVALSILLSLDAVRRRNFVAHGAWMIRGYAIGLGAGTQVLTHLPCFALADQPNELGRAVAMGAGWVINVVVAEVIIRRNRLPHFSAAWSTALR